MWSCPEIKEAEGKISAQPHTKLCIQFLTRENNEKNNTFPLENRFVLTIVWGCAETLPKLSNIPLNFSPI